MACSSSRRKDAEGLTRNQAQILRTKGRVYRAVVRSILLYGCETWPVQVTDKKVLEVYYNNSIRRIHPIDDEASPIARIRGNITYSSEAGFPTQD